MQRSRSRMEVRRQPLAATVANRWIIRNGLTFNKKTIVFAERKRVWHPDLEKIMIEHLIIFAKNNQEACGEDRKLGHTICEFRNIAATWTKKITL